MTPLYACLVPGEYRATDGANSTFDDHRRRERWGADSEVLTPREPSRVDPLAMENVFSVLKQSPSEKHSHRHIASVLGAQLVKTVAVHLARCLQL